MKKTFILLASAAIFLSACEKDHEVCTTCNEWTKKADFLGKARSWAVNFVIDNKAYVGTGTDNSPYAKDFYAYDATTNA